MLITQVNPNFAFVKYRYCFLSDIIWLLESFRLIKTEEKSPSFISDTAPPYPSIVSSFINYSPWVISEILFACTNYSTVFFFKINSMNSVIYIFFRSLQQIKHFYFKVTWSSVENAKEIPELGGWGGVDTGCRAYVPWGVWGPGGELIKLKTPSHGCEVWGWKSCSVIFVLGNVCSTCS